MPLTPSTNKLHQKQKIMTSSNLQSRINMDKLEVSHQDSVLLIEFRHLDKNAFLTIDMLEIKKKQKEVAKFT